MFVAYVVSASFAVLALLVVCAVGGEGRVPSEVDARTPADRERDARR
jgi:hypothetical protein